MIDRSTRRSAARGAARSRPARDARHKNEEKRELPPDNRRHGPSRLDAPGHAGFPGIGAQALHRAEVAVLLDGTVHEAPQRRKRGNLDVAEQYANRALALAFGLRDRRILVFAESELAVIAAARGDAARAGLLWGAVEAEASAGRVGQWEGARAELEALVLVVDGPEDEVSQQVTEHWPSKHRAVRCGLLVIGQ